MKMLGSNEIIDSKLITHRLMWLPAASVIGSRNYYNYLSESLCQSNVHAGCVDGFAFSFITELQIFCKLNYCPSSNSKSNL